MPRLNYEQQHLRNMLRLEKRIEKLFDEAAARVALLSESVDGFSPEEVFSFDKYPYLRNRAKKLMFELHGALSTTVVDGVRTEWDLANAKNDLLVRSVLGSAAKHLSTERRARYFSTNAGACTAFLARRERGMNLSERVWNLTEQFKEELEMGLDLGLRDGVSAVEMSRTLRAYLRNPDALFRRVRDEHGVLHLSERAKAYHPGRGVYRSAYKNARRLTATEVNIAYRTADHLRMQELDFVVGVEINLSENHTCLGADGKPHRFHDICDDLKGKYPKTFKFTGWHPHCRCYATPILKTEEEFDADTERILQGEEPTEGSENAVDDLPDEFKAWAKENKERIDAATARGSLPYFIKDNESLVDSVFAPKKKTLLEIAEERHAKRTKEEEDAIRQRWAARAKEHAEVKNAAAETIKTAADFGEVDASGLAQAVESGQIAKIKAETTKLQSAIEDMKKAEDELSDLIPNAHKWHKEFSLEDLKNTHAAVQKKLATFEGMSLEEQADVLKYETQWVADKKKYSTWQVAESAYKAQHAAVLEKIEWQKVDDQIEGLSSFKTKSPIFKQAIADAKAAQEKGDIAKAKEALEIAEKKRAELEKKKQASKSSSGTWTVNNTPQKGHVETVWPTEGSKKAKIRELTGVYDERKIDDYYNAAYGFSYQWDYEIRRYQSGLLDHTFVSRHGHTYEEIKKRAEDLEEWIDRSPKWKGGTTYRGMCLSRKQLNSLVDSLKSEEGAGMLGASSWSTRKDMAQVFSEHGLYDPITEYEYKTQRVVLIARKQKNATSLQYLSEFQDECEVISSNRNRYKLIEIREEDGYVYIEVEPK
nr:MAG TPA: minor capsid protein [Caudoviricetes sp.]